MQIIRHAQNVRGFLHAMWRIKKVRIVCLTLAAIILLVEAVPLIVRVLQPSNYDLETIKTLVDPTSKDLRQKLSFDGKTSTWIFNSNAEEQLPGQAADGVSVGGVTYKAELPTNMKRTNGLKLTDAASKIDMKMTPQFGLGSGKVKEGYAVYPLAGSDAQLVYTFHNNGVKEDIILYSAPGKTASFSYALDIPDTLEARLLDDGSVGVYGGSQALFGNISYGSDEDKKLVEKARKNSKKDQLYYAIPAPVIKGDKTNSAKAQFKLEGDKLTIEITGLRDAQYPLSIDPSFVMNVSGCSWQNGGNNEGNLSYTGCQLTRSGLSGGKVGTWTNNTNAMVSDYSNTEAVVSNGYLYILGGQIDSGGSIQGVQYAQINATNGTVGPLHFTHNSIDDNTTYVSGYDVSHNIDFQAVAYNGYIYVVGGANNQTVTNTVQYAKVNNNGTVGTWQTASGSMNSNRKQFGLEVYDGYLYAIAGCTSVNLGLACTGYSNTVESAPIRGNGDVGAWTVSGNNLTTTRFKISSVVSNGFIYALGGCVSNSGGLDNCSGGHLASVEYAALGSNGTIGSWSVVNSFSTARVTHNSVVSNGYMYLLGGAAGGGGILSDVQLAKIYANGKLGPWQTTTALAGNRKEMGVTTYNGYIYTAGGCSAAGANCGGSGGIAEVRYSQVSTALGDVSSFAADSDLMTAATEVDSSTVYGGYLYVQSGTTLQFAKLNDDGTNGAWATTAALPFARNLPAMVAHDGWLYIAGGAKPSAATADCPNDAGINYCRDVIKAAISNTDGTLGAWGSAAGSHYSTVGRNGLGATIYNGYIYIIGGNYSNNSNVTGEVNIAPLDSSGNAGTWTTSSMGGSYNRSNFGNVAVSGKYVYIAGGRVNGSWERTDVIYSTLSDGGGMSAWASAGVDMPTTRIRQLTAVHNGYIYVAGGQVVNATNYVPTDSVIYAKINQADGTLTGSWTTSSSIFAQSRFHLGGGVYNGFLYGAGGCVTQFLGACSGTPRNDVQSFQIYNGGGGANGGWATQGVTDSSARIQLASATYNGYVYIGGGCSGNLGAGPMGCTNLGMIDDVRYAAVGGDGTLGTWASVGSDFSTPRTGLTMVAYNGYLYALGGCSAGSSGNCTTFQNDVQYALICTGSNSGVGGCGSTAGTVGTWNPTNSFSTGRYGLTGLAANGYMYILGGCSATAGGSCTTYQNDVQKALICTGSNSGVGGCGSTAGTVGTWSSAGSNFTTGRLYQAAAINGDYMYIMAGCSAMSGVACTTFQNDLQYRQLDASTGNLTGSWTTGSSIGKGRFGAVAVTLNGYLYLTGGCTEMSGGNCGTTLDTTSYTTLYTNGLTGNWVVTGSRLATPRALHGAVASKGHLIILNGVEQTNSFVLTASTAPLLSTPQQARHSMLLNTDKTTTPANFFSNVSAQSVGSKVNVGFAQGVNSASPAFNAVVTQPGISSTTKYALRPNGDGGMYYRVVITLDDSQSMTFGETTGSSMSYLQLNYHPNPSMRLRGGKTFNQSTQQSLDAR